MNPKLALLPLLLATADAAPPLVPHTEGRIHVDVPKDWKLLVKDEPQNHNVTMSSGVTTSVVLFFYDYVKGATPDIMLDILVKTVHQTLPIGDIEAGDRAPLPGLSNPWELVTGKQMNGRIVAMGYTMQVGLVAIVDQPNQRMVAAFQYAPAEEFEAIGGLATVADVARSLWLDSDPLRPTPAWYWNAQPPDAIARPTNPAQP